MTTSSKLNFRSCQPKHILTNRTVNLFQYRALYDTHQREFPYCVCKNNKAVSWQPYCVSQRPYCIFVALPHRPRWGCLRGEPVGERLRKESFPVCIHRPQRGRTMRNRGWCPKGEPVDRQRYNSPTPAVSHSTLFPLSLQRVWYSVVTLSHPGFNWLIIYILQAWQQYDNKNKDKDKICCHACKILFISKFNRLWRRDNKKSVFLGRRRRWMKR